jgi:hypothetical protein
MFNYKKLLKSINIEGKQDDETDINDMYDIKNVEINGTSENLLDSIIQHPFIDNIDFNESQLVKDFHIVFYRIKTFNEYNYIEYYINEDFLKVSLKFKTNILDIYDNIIMETDKKINGIKKLKGIYEYNDNKYMFIQVRENNNTNMWVNLWDIVVANHYFGKRFDNHVIDFFINNDNISNLKMNKQILLKPNILYCHIDKKYLSYVDKHNSIQYCQDDSLIKLHRFNKNDNVRVICFMNFDKFNSYGSNNENLKKNGFIIDKINKCWIFQNEDNLFIHIK